VWEWCSDQDDPEFYANGPPLDPRLPARPDSEAVVVRGGAWMFDDPRSLRTFTRGRQAAASRLAIVGFRCAA
jgi:serine/threonine-protein kinase